MVNISIPYFFSPNLTNLPLCPPSTSYPELVKFISFPSIVFISIALGLLSLIFGVVTAIFYNSVPVYEKKEHLGVVSTNERLARKSEVSNTLWICYFISMALRYLNIIDSFFSKFERQFSLWKHTTEESFVRDDIGLVSVSLAFYGLSSFFLTLALNHQRVHRSEFSSKIEKRSLKNSSSNSINNYTKLPKTLGDRVKGFFFRIEAFFLALLILYLLAIVGLFVSTNQSAVPQPEKSFYVFVAIYAAQRLPILVLLVFIVLNINPEEGPKWSTKFLLIIGVVLSLLNEIPETIISYLLNDWTHWRFLGKNAEQCIVGGWFSGVDIVHFCYIISQVLFFIFLVIEFQRNKGPCIWSIVSKREDGYFDFRKFEDETQPDGMGSSSSFYASSTRRSQQHFTF